MNIYSLKFQKPNVIVAHKKICFSITMLFVHMTNKMTFSNDVKASPVAPQMAL